jgi:hypothetical protein
MYRTIDAAFWTDPDVKRLNPPEKLLFLYLVTNPHTHVSGIYILQRELMCVEIGYPPNVLDPLCTTLSTQRFCSFDDARSIVWVRNMFAYQGIGDKNSRSAAYHLAEDLHKSPLIIDFCTRYPRVREYLPPGFLDTLSIRNPVGATPDSRSLIPDSRILNPEPSLQDSPNLKNNSLLELVPPPAKKRGGHPRDLASDCYAAKCRERTGVPYVPEGGDFVMLAKLRNAFTIPARQLPPDWEQACENYFASPLGQYSLADLANPKRYAVFKNSPVDEFNKPIHRRNRNGPDKETHGERVARKNRETAALIDQQLFGTARDGPGADHSTGADPALLPRPK